MSFNISRKNNKLKYFNLKNELNQKSELGVKKTIIYKYKITNNDLTIYVEYQDDILKLPHYLHIYIFNNKFNIDIIIKKVKDNYDIYKYSVNNIEINEFYQNIEYIKTLQSVINKLKDPIIIPIERYNEFYKILITIFPTIIF